MVPLLHSVVILANSSNTAFYKDYKGVFTLGFLTRRVQPGLIVLYTLAQRIGGKHQPASIIDRIDNQCTEPGSERSGTNDL